MAMIMVVLNFARVFTDMGISNAIIHRQDTTRDQLSSLYWLNIFAGLAVFLIIILCAPLIVSFYREPRLEELIPCAALSLIVMPFGQQFQILLQKELSFDCLAKQDITATAVGVMVSILTALAGHGVFSIIWGELAHSAAKTAMLIKVGWSSWKPGFHFARRDLKNYLDFGLYQMGERSINYLSANIDYILIGRFLGKDVLGVYRIAYELVVMPLMRINPVLTRVAFPVFSIKQDDDPALRRGYLELTKIIAYLTLPLIVGLAVVAPVFVPVAFGEGWEGSVVLIQILAAVGVIKALFNPCGSIFLAKGRADIGFWLNVFVATVNTLVFLAAVKHGVYAVAWCYLGLSISYVPIIWTLLKRVIGLDIFDYLKTLIGPAAISAAMGAVTCLLFYLLQSEMTSLQLLILLTAAGGALYAALCLIFEKQYFLGLIQMILNRNQGTA
jgi:O-antigen/teichoic acid export membrane protein